MPRCPRADAFPVGGEWQDLIGYSIYLLQLLDQCNGQIHDFWLWYDGQIVNSVENNSDGS